MPDDEYTFISLLSILLKRSRVSDIVYARTLARLFILGFVGGATSERVSVVKIWFIAYYLFMFI